MSDSTANDLEFEQQLNEFLQSIKIKNARLALSSSLKLLDYAKLTKKGIPMALSKLVLATYLNKHFGEDFYINFKSYLGEIEDFESQWEEAKKIIVLDILDLYRGLSSYLKNDYFTTVNPFKQIAEYLNEDENIKLANINRLLMLCHDCSSTISKAILSDIASIGLKRIINSIQVQKEGNYNEKHLEKSMTFIKNYVPKEQQNDLNTFLSQLMFEFAISDSITKKAAALQNFTGFRAFSQETIEKLNEYKVVDHLIADLHQDLVPKFVTFFIKMWNSGQFIDEQLEKYWNVCVNEHQTIIDKFFADWPRLFASIPKEKMHVFWEVVIHSPKYPKAALDFLIKVAPKAEDITKCKLITSLSNCEEKIDCVYAICEYAKVAPTISQAVISNAYTGLHKGKNKYFHILVLLNLLKEPTMDDLGHVLDYGQLDPKESRPLFELILKICRILNHNLTKEEFDKLKILIEPVIIEDSRLVTLFLNQLILNHIIDTTLVHTLLSWLVSQSHVMTDFIFSLFLFINNLDNNNQFDNFDLVGFQSILTVLKNSDDPEVATFMTNLIMRCRNNQLIDNLIVQIMEEYVSNASLITISNLIYQIETILVNPPKCNKFEYSPLITIKPTDKGSIMIPFGSTVDFFKRRVESYLNTDFNQLEFFIGEDPLTDIHHFTANEEITVKSPIFGNGARKWSKSEYPTTVLARYSGKLFDIVKANSKESENALTVLNLLPTIESESNIFKSKTPNWKEVFDTKYPYVLLYRMNILSHLINLKNRRDITYIFTSGGFKYLLKLIIDNKSIFSRPEHVDLFACSVGMLVASVATIEEAKDSKLETYNSLGYKAIMDSLIIWVHNIKFEERSYSLMVQNIMFIICDVARYNADPLLENENFVDIFKSTIFDNRYYLQEVFGSVIASTDMIKIEPIILSFVEYARNGNCLSYFKLVKKLAQISNKPVEVWKTLAKYLMDNMFIMSPNAKLPEDFGHEKLYPKDFNKPKAKKGKKKPKVSNATDDNGSNNEELNNFNSVDSKSDRSSFSSQETHKSPSAFDLKDESQDNFETKTIEENNKNSEENKAPKDNTSNLNEENPKNSEENSDISNNNVPKSDNNEQNTQNNDKKTGSEQNTAKFAPNDIINSQNKQEDKEKVDKRPTIFAETTGDDKQQKDDQESEYEEEEKEEVRYLHPGPQFTVEELKEAALMMSANVADPMFVSSIFETLLLLVERVDNPIPYAEELCMFALNKIAFNVSRIIPAPHDLFDLIVSIVNKDGSVGNTIFNRLTVLKHDRNH
ncbi:hypothetical protein TVAG_370100 [Trichomonas vaginalis G3]|uniref:Uncharacterized protein n=1 Tax=Trichomonas vaginalis (strain ATCC PRA-98 / G3) TaxID=412133 RepID=A2EX62_TRIV3|nr:ubiquitinyl hydrolase protein [Trichomonas vaginalis G3]EAY02782.1 hypothetical protein TVAG_370100 [Trichomonas vaginalis G3]KAI5500616.1 ubiquitinyl hydrolase protein [Trichomonas vaginalis G3]|eukprot:XP_001315005.1 hypothetical protein [Trichomonas vaginalis G3]